MQFTLSGEGKFILRKHHLLVVIIFLVGFLYLETIFTIIPGYSIPNLGISLWSAGFGDSLSKGSVLSYPIHMGYPLGAPVVFGLPISLLQVFFQKSFHISSLDAYLSASLLSLLFAFLGVIFLVRKMGGGGVFSIFTAVLYLSNPVIWGHLGYGPLAFSFALLPTYCWAIWVGAELILSGKTAQTVFGFFIQVFTVVVAIFLDGYGFVMLGVIAPAFLVASLKNYDNIFMLHWKKVLLLLGLLLFSYFIAYSLYNIYIPSVSSYHIESLDYFRAMAVDLQTLVLPQKGYSYLYDFFGLSISRSQAQFYGDPSSYSMNFLGISIILVPFSFFYGSLSRFFKVSLILVSFFAFMMSLGPNLKVASYRDKDAVLYRMPAEKTVCSLGTSLFYSKVPGINNMRATYRWIVLVKFIVFMFVVSLFISIGMRFNRFAYLLLFALLLLENGPALNKRIAQGFSFYRQAEGIKQEFVKPLSKIVKKHSRVVFFPLGNDFLVNYVSPQLEILSYNVGGDKNVALAAQKWPAEIKNIKNKINIKSSVDSLSSRGELDVLVVPYLDLLWSAHWWPPTKDEVAKGRRAFQSIKGLFRNDNYLIVEDKYFVAIVLGKQAH